MSHTVDEDVEIEVDPAITRAMVKHNARLLATAPSIEQISLVEIIDVAAALRLLRSGMTVLQIHSDPPRNPYLQ